MEERTITTDYGDRMGWEGKLPWAIEQCVSGISEEKGETLTEGGEGVDLRRVEVRKTEPPSTRDVDQVHT